MIFFSGTPSRFRFGVYDLEMLVYYYFMGFATLGFQLLKKFEGVAGAAHDQTLFQKLII